MGITVPAIIDKNTWQLAQKKRENARTLITDPKGWLLQGMCYCGKCVHKRHQDQKYYACRGRIQPRIAQDGDGRCDLPFMRADWLEWGVWEKVKEVLNDSGKLAECVNKALIELEERKAQFGVEILDVDGKLETLRAKMERLGMAFADGAMTESAYKSKLKQLKKQEASLVKCRHNIDPLELTELAELEGRIAMIQNALSQGNLDVNEFGIFGLQGEEYIPTGLNAWRESDGELAIGKVTGKDYFRLEGTNKYMRGIDVPPGFWECGDYAKQDEIIKKNMRAILQLFGIKVIVYPDRVEIKGTIPQQVLYKGEVPEPESALFISSASPLKGEGGSAII